MFTFYLDAMVAQPRHEILQCDGFMEESTHVSFLSTLDSLCWALRYSESQVKIRRVFLINFYCITALLFWSLELARHYSAVTKIPCAPLKNSLNLTKYGELEFSIARNRLIQHEFILLVTFSFPSLIVLFV